LAGCADRCGIDERFEAGELDLRQAQGDLRKKADREAARPGRRGTDGEKVAEL
jgi:hypothetical protein